MASANRGSVVGSVERLYQAGVVSALGEGQLLDRFLKRGDGPAFEAIVVRHGPMVMGVCRRVLDDPHDADDAFQATFLVLVKKARGIRNPDVLGPWLYGVARRVSVRARVNARRRQARERTGTDDLGIEAPRVDRAEADELRALIDDELGRLPARYRAPVVLCDLQGQTHEQAAAQLRCPVGTVKSRLSRGRERLRSRLVRRGVAPSVGLLASTLAPGSASALSVGLLRETVNAATAVASGAFPAGVAALTKGTIRSMNLSTLRLGTASVLAVALTIAGAGALVRKATGQAKDDKPRAGQAQAVAERLAPADAPAVDMNKLRHVLGNGLTVYLRPIRGAKHTALVVVYSVGGDHDPEGKSGLAHSIEHVYLAAAAGDQKARTTREFFSAYPDGANGQTGDRYTVFSTSFAPEDMQKELRDASARMGDLRVTADDLEGEKPRILAEVDNMFRRFPALSALNNARELVRPSPGGRRGGTPAQIKAITADDIRAHWRRYYKPLNAILAMAGDFDAAAALKAVSENFAGLPRGEQAPSARKPDKPKFGEFIEKAGGEDVPNPEPVACVAYVAPRPGDKDYAPFLVLVTRLWAAAGKLGNSGSAGMPVYFTPLDDGAVVAVSAPFQRGGKPAEGFDRLKTFVSEVIGPKLGGNELSTVRQQLGFILGTVELPDNAVALNPYGVAFSLARREQLGLDPAALNKALDAVTDDDVRRVAKQVFGTDRCAGAAAIP